MTFVGIGPNGDIKLPVPIRIRLDRDADAPADAFEGVFPCSAGFQPITNLKIFDSQGNVCFDGIVDEQENSLTNKVLIGYAYCQKSGTRRCCWTTKLCLKPMRVHPVLQPSLTDISVLMGLRSMREIPRVFREFLGYADRNQRDE
jgi:hypothetical protein